MEELTLIGQRVKSAIVQSLRLSIDPNDIADDESLFEGVGVDSIAALEIIFALEQEFGIEVDDEELRVDLFDSVNSMVRYVSGKLASR